MSEAPESSLGDVWLVDRSRVQAGRVACKRARYREYHSGPTGYGIRRRAQSLPLVTGQQVHKILARLVSASIEYQGTYGVPDVFAREAILQQKRAYEKRCERRGFLEIAEQDDQAGAEIKRVIAEQAALVEALGWALHLVWLPQLLEAWEPCRVEQEMLFPLTDSIQLMSRSDMILKRRSDGALAQFEAKTVGGWLYLPSWRKQWEDSVQLMLTKIAAEHELKEPISFAYIFAMDKGKRSEEKATGLLKQWTPFLYAYHKPANPPFWEEDWQLRWEWVDSEGKSRRLGKGYERTAVYLYNFQGKPVEMSAVEYWMRSLPADEIEGMREVLGPYDFLNHSQESILTALRAEEQRWQEALWAIHETGEAVGWEESHPNFVTALDEYAPQSWNCHMYGKDCQFLPVCRREPLWPAPHEDERFELRRPHHEPELEQMKARGIEPPEDQDEEEGEPA